MKITMNRYQTLQSEFMPAGVVTDIDDFKTHVIDEVHDMMKIRGKYIEQYSGVPLPIGIYVLFDDLSVMKTLLIPTSAEEKRYMIMAVKKQNEIVKQVLDVVMRIHQHVALRLPCAPRVPVAHRACIADHDHLVRHALEQPPVHR